MSATGALLDRLAPVTGTGARSVRGRAWFEEHGFPDRKQEAWRYTPLVEIIDAFESAQPAPPASLLIDRSLVDERAGDLGGPRLVFVNGVLVPTLSDLDEVQVGLWLGGADALAPRRRPDAPPSVDEPADGFHALNWAAGRDVAAVLIDPEAEIVPPIHIVHMAAPSGDSLVAHPRTVIRLGRGSRSNVIETFTGVDDGKAITNASTRIIAGEGATFGYHQVIDAADPSIHVGRTTIEQDASSTVRATSLILGGGIVRSATDVRLGGPDAHVDLRGFFRPTGHQRHDNVVTVDHAADRGVSAQRYKGIAADHGRGSFSGHVIVRPDTVGTDARQSNPNLVLSPGAQIDTRPWLEIFADDVRCTHGATVGRLDPEAMFFLRSRGIPVDRARAMLVAGFAAEIIDTITPDSLRDRVAATVGAHRTGELV